MIVDCHAHLVPPALLAAIRKHAAKFPNVRLVVDAGLSAAQTASINGGLAARLFRIAQ